MAKKYYTDLLFYDKVEDVFYGDMGFAFCDMPETETKTLKETTDNIKFGISEDVRLGEVDEENITIYLALQVTYKGDEEISRKYKFAMCQPCPQNVFEFMKKKFEESNYDGVKLLMWNEKVTK